MTTAVPGIDFARLMPWFSEHVEPVDDLEATIVGHGRSNLTYRLDAGAGRCWVLRRPPLSHVQPTAHDMKREFRVISAMAGTGVPVPETMAMCEDPAVLGAPFYIMQHVDGFVPADAVEFARRYPEGDRPRMAHELIDTLARLHGLAPERVGLGDFGKPQGFIARQVRRFTEQIAAPGRRETPELDELARRLAASIPADSGVAIVHGDYRLDNCILDGEGHIAAVLDWEMATLGDPLADIGMLMMYWMRGVEGAAASAGSALTVLPGFPTRAEMLDRYAQKSGRDLGSLDFYHALAYFKLAAILENMHARYLAGGTVGAGFEAIGAQALALARGGLQAANDSSIPALRGEL